MSAQYSPKPRIVHLVQAPVRPLDEDGVVVGITGTIGWAITTFILWLNLDWLQNAGHGWWIRTSIAGTVLGVIGTSYCWWRKSKRPGSDSD